MKTKFIFVTGGVVSSLGKGINASSIGRLLKCRGLKVFMQKLDPYINVDPGKMSPLQHGEVFVTDDGAETDLDLGHYERFIDENLNRYSSVTTGKIYLKVIEKERNGEYDGATVQVIPHITNEIKNSILNVAKTSKADIVITEIGGTVGDIESLPFLEAIRQFRRDIGYRDTMYIHNTLVPYLENSGELKTKPTQHSVKELRSLGINPDMIILRANRSIPQSQKEKIALFCDVDVEAVIEAQDQTILYEMPNIFAQQGVDSYICRHLGLNTAPLDLNKWSEMILKIKNLKGEVKIGLVGKYVALKDSYISVNESLKHGAYYNNTNIKIIPIDSGSLTNENIKTKLDGFQGIVIPGGFDSGHINGTMATIKFVRENKIPFLGICLGMHLSVIEYARNVLGFTAASSIEFDQATPMPIITVKESRKENGDSMRLGLYDCEIKPGTKAAAIYNKKTVKERHRHRYEINNEYIKFFSESDLTFSGFNNDENIVELMELNNHPFFIACQYRPEFLSRPNRPHPLFTSFISAAMQRHF
ncbi:MAG: CTP synthase [Bacilli bacterium]|nr:CTP synthase [Bacilli bacterium]MDD4076598.1 CTP synthase [Bacilli bacterium]MDD4387703.1 CTP synthase [Bacilli bacterium]